eukprot:NODE_702_length_1412_cov_76.688188_g520_i0.p1 GENE.NODE_702_length_1412_cov_76.688188_g520_i0~~NODE_702_length_1412_cov_76.688188_g520_i0.p1  ORF type:complete len:225 (+),score=67.70 NODE_702_length_1412_cov_76.688188_g520_i0:309-983(+)
MAGVFLGFGASLTVLVRGAAGTGALAVLQGAMVFPVGLTLIVFCGADLLTGYMMYCTMPFFTKPEDFQGHAQRLALVWGIVAISNLLGCLGLASFAASFFFAGTPAATFAAQLAVAKCSLPFGTAFCKAVGANFLVCTALYGSIAATSPGGKVVCIWLPIATFVALGLEHSIANMFLIPLGMHFTDAISIGQFFGNQVPVLAGNAVGAVIFSWWIWHRHGVSHN